MMEAGMGVGTDELDTVGASFREAVDVLSNCETDTVEVEGVDVRNWVLCKLDEDTTADEPQAGDDFDVNALTEAVSVDEVVETTTFSSWDLLSCKRR